MSTGAAYGKEVFPINKYNVVAGVESGSIAAETGIAPGDVLLKINGRKIHDILEYRYYCANEQLQVELQKAGGGLEVLEIEKDPYEDLGIVFQYPLMSGARSCANKCIFCFIDQLPAGMRKTLYFKDDDSRLSFLQGNYVTLTNLTRRELDSIAEMKVSPINISVHATDPALRCFMMGNRKAGNVLHIMRSFAARGITMNCQIVLCKDVNDGEQMDRTIRDLALMFPQVYSVSVVPVGLSDHREGLYPLRPFGREDARKVLHQVERWQQEMLKKNGSRFVYAADEFYLKAETAIPDVEDYEDFPQIENGVGLLASLQYEFDDCLPDFAGRCAQRTISIATGTAAYEFMRGLAERLMQSVQGLDILVYRIENTVFGKNVTVAGLVCGTDILHQLAEKPLGEALYISASMLREGEEIFLDDVTLGTMEKELGVPVVPVGNDGGELITKLTNLSI